MSCGEVWEGMGNLCVQSGRLVYALLYFNTFRRNWDYLAYQVSWLTLFGVGVGVHNMSQEPFIGKVAVLMRDVLF